MADNRKLAETILEAVGGPSNVTHATHCMTRLRLNLKDESIVNDDEIKNIKGVLGVVNNGGQKQIIIGTTVKDVYQEFANISGASTGSAKKDDGAESASSETKKLSLKSAGSAILDTLAGSLTPIIPVILAASIFKMIISVFGPDMLNIISAESDFYTLCATVGDAGYYFFPLLIGYTSAKKMDVSPVMGIFMGAILLHPNFVTMAAEGTPFTVYGIPAAIQNYSSTLIPVILCVWAMSYIEKFLNKHVPSYLKILLVPVLTIAVMLPIGLCVLAPAGAFIGKYLCSAIIAFSNTFGFIGAAIIGAFWEFLVMTGMHHVLITQMILVITEAGYDTVVAIGAYSASIAVAGMCLGMALTQRDKEDKALSIGYFVSSIVGGVTEPGLYGIGMKFRKPFIGMAVGGFAGALYMGIMGVKAFFIPATASLIWATTFAGENTGNLINGIIGIAISFVVSTIVTYILCREKKGA